MMTVVHCREKILQERFMTRHVEQAGCSDTLRNKTSLIGKVLTSSYFSRTASFVSARIISNLEMGYIFEEIIRRFSESHNEDAGQHYTPREVTSMLSGSSNSFSNVYLLVL